MDADKVEFLPVVESTLLDRASAFGLGRRLFVVSELSEDELRLVVHHHLREVRESCLELSEAGPLLGGLVIRLNGKVALEPQCCGDLSDIESWFAALEQPEGSTTNVCPEGHPMPRVTRLGSVLEVTCGDERDPLDEYKMGTLGRFSFRREQARSCLDSVRSEIEAFGRRLDLLGQDYGGTRLSDILLVTNNQSRPTRS